MNVNCKVEVCCESGERKGKTLLIMKLIRSGKFKC